MPDAKIYPLRWENISENTFRLCVPGGWLVRDVHTFICGDKSCAIAIEGWFVDDPLHDKWILSRN